MAALSLTSALTAPSLPAPSLPAPSFPVPGIPAPGVTGAAGSPLPAMGSAPDVASFLDLAAPALPGEASPVAARVPVAAPMPDTPRQDRAVAGKVLPDAATPADDPLAWLAATLPAPIEAPRPEAGSEVAPEPRAVPLPLPIVASLPGTIDAASTVPDATPIAAPPSEDVVPGATTKPTKRADMRAALIARSLPASPTTAAPVSSTEKERDPAPAPALDTLDPGQAIVAGGPEPIAPPVPSPLPAPVAPPLSAPVPVAAAPRTPVKVAPTPSTSTADAPTPIAPMPAPPRIVAPAATTEVFESPASTAKASPPAARPLSSEMATPPAAIPETPSSEGTAQPAAEAPTPSSIATDAPVAASIRTTVSTGAGASAITTVPPLAAPLVQAEASGSRPDVAPAALARVVAQVAPLPTIGAVSPRGAPSRPTITMPGASGAPMPGRPEATFALAATVPVAPTIAAPTSVQPVQLPLRSEALTPAPAAPLAGDVATGDTALRDPSMPAPDRRAAPVTTPPIAAATPLPAVRVDTAGRTFAAAIHRAVSSEAPAAPAIAAAPVAAVVPTADVAVIAPPLDLRDTQWPARMIDRIAAFQDMVAETRALKDDLSIRLVPDALGTVDVSLKRDGDQVQVQITAEHAQTRQLLAEAAPKLAELAEKSGVRLHQPGADAANTGTSGQRPQQHSAQQHSQAPQPRARRAAADATSQSDAERVA